MRNAFDASDFHWNCSNGIIIGTSQNYLSSSSRNDWRAHTNTHTHARTHARKTRDSETGPPSSVLTAAIKIHDPRYCITRSTRVQRNE